MVIVIIVILLLVGLLVKSVIDEKEYDRKLTRKLLTQWGTRSDQEYTYEKYESIKKYYKKQKIDSTDVDSITWNDIDMDEIYMLINNTQCSIGEEYLYALLHKLQFDEHVLEERNQLIQSFIEEEDDRVSIQKCFAKMGKLDKISFYEYINLVDDIKSHNPFKHYLCCFGLLGSIFSVFIPGFMHNGFLLTILFVGINIFYYYKRKSEVEKYLSVFAYILKMLSNIDELEKIHFEGIKPYVKSLKEAGKQFKKFRRNSFFLVAGRNMSGDLLDIILDYIRMLFHIDLIKFDIMLSEVQKKREWLNSMFEQIGYLDSMIAIASFRVLLDGKYCIPQLRKGKKNILQVKNVYHPLITNPVENSMEEDKCVLLTGSNASGKSTFIKTIAINAILSQTIYTSLSEFYYANYFMVYSSMALQDSIQSSESYYIVEIKSLKRILDLTNKDIPMLCFVDEVLRGTNTVERIAASAQILKSFTERNTLCFAATHDIELTYILEKYYSNYHFQEEIKEKEVVFDYKLYKNRATSRNAIRLLGMLGYEEELIQKADKEVNYFMDHNNWSVFG